MKRSIKEPIPAISLAADAMSQAVDAHIQGQTEKAFALFKAADNPDVWAWVNPAWARPDLNVIDKKPLGDTTTISRGDRDPDRNIAPAVKAAVLSRDGHRCRYCEIPVVDAAIRKIAVSLYPGAIPWDPRDPARQHAGFQCLWLQYDHVIPHSHGGRSVPENLVICCALCNFGKDRYTLRQLGLLDPRDRPPEPTNWDGLERLRITVPTPVIKRPASGYTRQESASASQNVENTATEQVYFLPGAWISKGYLYTPEIEGKQRWFDLRSGTVAMRGTNFGKDGCYLVCKPEAFLKRGINPQHYLPQ